MPSRVSSTRRSCAWPLETTTIESVAATHEEIRRSGVWTPSASQPATFNLRGSIPSSFAAASCRAAIIGRITSGLPSRMIATSVPVRMYGSDPVKATSLTTFCSERAHDTVELEAELTLVALADEALLRASINELDRRCRVRLELVDDPDQPGEAREEDGELILGNRAGEGVESRPVTLEDALEAHLRHGDALHVGDRNQLAAVLLEAITSSRRRFSAKARPPVNFGEGVARS